MSLDIFQLTSRVDQLICERKWDHALGACSFILSDAFRRAAAAAAGEGAKGAGSIPPYLLRRTCRLVAEITCALAPGKVESTTLSAMLFAHVPPKEWAESQGVAAMILGVKKSNIGNVMLDWGTHLPFLVNGDDVCAACHFPPALGGGEMTIPCTECHAVCYCSKKHALSHWPSHKLACMQERYALQKKEAWEGTKYHQALLEQLGGEIEILWKGKEGLK